MSKIVTPETPWYARRNESGFYTWEGVQYRSVTTYLGFVAKQHLMLWYGKMAAQDCALQLDMFEKGQIELEEAFERIRDYGMRMRAGEVYRDRKAAIGSLVHHLLYNRAMGSPMLQNPSQDDLEAWLVSEGKRMRLLDRIEGEEVVDASDGDYRYVASLAAPYCKSAMDWKDDWRPQPRAIGQEAYVVSRTYGYAGTMDEQALHDLRLGDRRDTFNTITARSYRSLREYLEKDEAWGIDDYKTSNSLSETFRIQCEGYGNADFIGLMPVDGRPAEEHEIGDFDFVSVLHIKPYPDRTDLHVWPRSPQVFEGFLGLMDFVDVMTDPDTKKPMRVARTAKPKAPPKRTTEEPCPF